MTVKNHDRPIEASSLKGRHFFLTVPHFEGSLNDVKEALKTHQTEWEFLRYAMVKETHTNDVDKGTHLHLYVGFPRPCRVKLDRFDYLGKHGKLERVRSYASVLKYMTKENRPMANFDYIEDIMRNDFPRAVEILLSQGLHIRQIYKTYSPTVAKKNWSGYLRFLMYQEDTKKFNYELNKSGIRLITPELVKARLSDSEYQLYQSDSIYDRIVNSINDIVRYGSNRPHKARALFLCLFHGAMFGAACHTCHGI